MDIEGTFEAKGVHNAEERLKFVAAEVREPFPASIQEAGIDTLVMKHFLSGFSDADADLILKHCKQVLPSQGKILLLQTLVPEAGDRKHNVCRDGVAPGKARDCPAHGSFSQRSSKWLLQTPLPEAMHWQHNACRNEHGVPSSVKTALSQMHSRAAAVVWHVYELQACAGSQCEAVQPVVAFQPS